MSSRGAFWGLETFKLFGLSLTMRWFLLESEYLFCLLNFIILFWFPPGWGALLLDLGVLVGSSSYTTEISTSICKRVKSDV